MIQSHTEQASTVSSQDTTENAASGYTPGPWAVFHDHPDTDTAKSLAYIRPVKLPYDFYVNEIASIFCCNTEHYQTANARLIASAPDLVEALLAAREFIDGQIDVVDGSYGEPSPNRAMSLARLIDDVLAKAGA